MPLVWDEARVEKHAFGLLGVHNLGPFLYLYYKTVKAPAFARTTGGVLLELTGVGVEKPAVWRVEKHAFSVHYLSPFFCPPFKTTNQLKHRLLLVLHGNYWACGSSRSSCSTRAPRSCYMTFSNFPVPNNSHVVHAPVL